MELPDEILKQVQLLLDKPPSPTTTNQLQALLLKENANMEKCVHSLSLKYRGDLLIFIFENGRTISNNCIDQLITFMLDNVLMFKIGEFLQLYILLLGRMEQREKILDVAYSRIIKLVVKKANLETKEKLLQVVLSNCEYLYQNKNKKIVMAIVTNYLQVYSKFLIYVPTFVKIVEFCLEVDKNSKQILSKEHPEREEKLEEIFVDLSSQELNSVKNVTLAILDNTKDKANWFQLHRNCLVVLRKIGEELNAFKIKESEIYFTELEVGKICRTIEIYADRKGTIDEARLSKAEWLKRFQALLKIKEGKMEKVSSAKPFDYSEDNFPKVPLIEEVISMTNNYRLKYQVDPEADSSRILEVCPNFLKKGTGAGGGKTHLLDGSKQPFPREEIKSNTSHRGFSQRSTPLRRAPTPVKKEVKKEPYEKIIDQCFQICEKEPEIKSFVDYQPQFENKISEPVKEFKDLKNLQKGLQNPFEQSERLEILVPNTQNKTNLNNSISTSSLIEDDEEVQEISNLIELAYSYKFT